MLLSVYQAQTTNLLQDPPAPSTLFSTTQLTQWINTARRQLAGESGCIRYLGAITAIVGTNVYPLSVIDTGTSSVTGIEEVASVRQMFVGLGTGQVILYPRSFEWFSQYCLNSAAPANGVTTTWSQYGDGDLAALYVYPAPKSSYIFTVDVTCLPIDLVDDSTVDAIPSLFSDAVPYFAAYLALMSAQRYQDAQAMYQLYGVFLKRARTTTTPGVLSGNRPQVADPTVPNKLGAQSSAGSVG